MYSIYLDDERNPKTNRDWTIVRSAQEAIDLIQEKGLPDYMSFDHDLGDNEHTGYFVAKWIDYAVQYELIKWNPDFQFNVHSANPVGASNIQARLDNLIYWKSGAERNKIKNREFLSNYSQGR